MRTVSLTKKLDGKRTFPYTCQKSNDSLSFFLRIACVCVPDVFSFLCVLVSGPRVFRAPGLDEPAATEGGVRAAAGGRGGHQLLRQ